MLWSTKRRARTSGSREVGRNEVRRREAENAGQYKNKKGQLACNVYSALVLLLHIFIFCLTYYLQEIKETTKKVER